MKPLPRPDNRVILGRGGSGKSHLARFQVRQARRLIIFDPNGEDAHAAEGDVADTKTDLVGLCSVTGNFRVCWRGFFRYGPQEGFEFANRLAWAAGGVTVLWDEADQFMQPGHLPPAAYRLVNMGRHRGCRVVALSRRPASVARGLTANAQRMIIFRMTEPLDLKYLGQIIGESEAAKLPGLGAYEALDWTEAGSRKRKSPFA